MQPPPRQVQLALVPKTDEEPHLVLRKRPLHPRMPRNPNVQVERDETTDPEARPDIDRVRLSVRRSTPRDRMIVGQDAEAGGHSDGLLSP